MAPGHRVASSVGLWLRSLFFTVLLPGTVVLWVPLAVIGGAWLRR